MGKSPGGSLPAARAVFDEVDAALAEKLTVIAGRGLPETLQLTGECPAGADGGLDRDAARAGDGGRLLGRPGCAFVAGHSLGEYSALAAAGSLSITDAARLLRTRASHAKECRSARCHGGIARASTTRQQSGRGRSRQGQVCQAANDKWRWAVVVSGDKAAVARALELQDQGAKRAMLLRCRPFHSN